MIRRIPLPLVRIIKNNENKIDGHGTAVGFRRYLSAEQRQRPTAYNGLDLDPGLLIWWNRSENSGRSKSRRTSFSYIGRCLIDRLT